MKSQIILYQTKPEYDQWLKLVLGGLPALFFVAALVFIPIDIEVTLVFLGTAVLLAVIFRAVLPQNILIYEDRLVIKLGGPFAVNVHLENIKEAKRTSAWHTFAYWGNRFATSTRNVIEIVRHKGMGITISPSSADEFLVQLNQARQSLSARR